MVIILYFYKIKIRQVSELDRAEAQNNLRKSQYMLRKMCTISCGMRAICFGTAQDKLRTPTRKIRCGNSFKTENGLDWPGRIAHSGFRELKMAKKKPSGSQR